MKLYYSPKTDKSNGVDISDPIVPVFDWRFDPETQVYEYVKTGEVDIVQTVEASQGHDVVSIIRRQPGATATEKIANAFDAGLIPESNPVDADLTAVSDDPVVNQVNLKEARRQASVMSEALGSQFSIDDFLNGKANDAIKRYLDKKIADSAKSAVSAGGDDK